MSQSIHLLAGSAPFLCSSGPVRCGGSLLEKPKEKFRFKKALPEELLLTVSNAKRHSFVRFKNVSTLIRATDSAAAVRATARAMGETTKVVDHLVYFKFKERDPEEMNATVASIRALAVLEHLADGILLFNMGEAIKPPAAESTYWTHGILARFKNKDALQKYLVSEEHVAVVNHILPLLDDVLVSDWEVELKVSPEDSQANIIHSAIMKLKAGTADDGIKGMVDGLRGHEGEIPGLQQVTLGENFSNDYPKDFGWGFASLHETRDDLKTYATSPVHFEVMKASVFPIVEKSESLDFDRNVPPLPTI